MAKIGDLEVDTLNLDYLSSFATGPDFVIATNPGNLPVQLFWRCDVQVQAQSQGSGSSLSIQISVSRVRAGADSGFYSRTGNWSNSGASFSINSAALDMSAQAGDRYNFTTTYQITAGTGFANFNNKSISAEWVEK